MERANPDSRTFPEPTAGVVSQSGTINCMDTCALPRWHGYETHSLHPWTNEKALCNLDGSSILHPTREVKVQASSLTSGQTLDPGLKDFFCDFFPPPMSKQDWCYVFKLFFWGLPACCQEDLCQTNIYLGQRRRCWYRMYGLSKGCYCFWEAKEGFNVCVRACMRKRQLTQIRHTGFQ